MTVWQSPSSGFLRVIRSSRTDQGDPVLAAVQRVLANRHRHPCFDTPGRDGSDLFCAKSCTVVSSCLPACPPWKDSFAGSYPLTCCILQTLCLWAVRACQSLPFQRDLKAFTDAFFSVISFCIRQQNGEENPAGPFRPERLIMEVGYAF